MEIRKPENAQIAVAVRDFTQKGCRDDVLRIAKEDLGLGYPKELVALYAESGWRVQPIPDAATGKLLWERRACGAAKGCGCQELDRLRHGAGIKTGISGKPGGRNKTRRGTPGG